MGRRDRDITHREARGRGRNHRPKRPPKAPPRLQYPTIGELEALEADYLAELEALGRRKATLRTYRLVLARMRPVLAKMRTLAAVAVEASGRAATTRRLHLAVASSFAAWVRSRGAAPGDWLQDRPLMRVDQADPRPIPAGIDTKMRRAAITLRGAPGRLYALLRGGGLRLGEARIVCWRDLADGAITVPSSAKGRRPRIVPLAAWALVLLRRTMKCPDDTAIIAARPRMTHVSESTARRFWQLICAQAKLEQPWPHPHSARHTAATEWIRKGVPAEHVRRLLGQRTVALLETYAEVTVKDLRESMGLEDE